MGNKGRFDDYLFRCSSLGKIVSKSGITEKQLIKLEELQAKKNTPKGLTIKQQLLLDELIEKRDKNDISDAAKTYLQELFIEEIYGVRKDIFGKALDKGVFCEEDGITMLQNTLLRGNLVIKNKERKKNDFITGECDVFCNDTIYDIKNALNIMTFAKADLSWDYKWQLVGYSWLWNTNKSVLYYCLNSMPEALLEEEKVSLFYKNRWKFSSHESEDYLKACKELEEANNYDNMPIELRFKFWNLDITEDDIDELKECVIRARVYLNKLYDEHIEQIKANKLAMNIN